MKKKREHKPFEISTSMIDAIVSDIESKNDLSLQKQFNEFHYADIAEILDEDCGCDERQEWLNEKTKNWPMYKKRKK